MSASLPVLPELFACSELRAKMTRESCAARSRVANVAVERTSANAGKNPYRLVHSPCRGCKIGIAHAAGKRPRAAPTVELGTALPAPAPPPKRSPAWLREGTHRCLRAGCENTYRGLRSQMFCDEHLRRPEPAVAKSGGKSARRTKVCAKAGARAPERAPAPPHALEEAPASTPPDHDAPVALLQAAGYTVQLACTTPRGPAFFVPGGVAGGESPGLALLQTAGYQVRQVSVPRGLFFFVEVDS